MNRMEDIHNLHFARTNTNWMPAAFKRCDETRSIPSGGIDLIYTFRLDDVVLELGYTALIPKNLKICDEAMMMAAPLI